MYVLLEFQYILIGQLSYEKCLLQRSSFKDFLVSKFQTYTSMASFFSFCIPRIFCGFSLATKPFHLDLEQIVIFSYRFPNQRAPIVRQASIAVSAATFPHEVYEFAFPNVPLLIHISSICLIILNGACKTSMDLGLHEPLYRSLEFRDLIAKWTFVRKTSIVSF